MHPLYLQNKYTRFYFDIVQKARARINEQVNETHHILPRALGGGDESDNLVKLTPREHFIVHALLPRMVTGEYRRKMLYAFWMMTVRGKNHSRYTPRASVLYESQRKAFVYAQTGKTLSDETKRKIGNAHRGKILSDETKRKISESKQGKSSPKTDDHRAAISASLAGRKNTWTHSTSEKQKEATRAANKNRVWSVEQRQHMSQVAKSRAGEIRSEEGRKNLSAGAKKRFSVPHITINNGIKNSLIPLSKLSDYPGWVRGRLKKSV
jgi:hypothetical protein